MARYFLQVRQKMLDLIFTKNNQPRELSRLIVRRPRQNTQNIISKTAADRC